MSRYPAFACALFYTSPEIEALSMRLKCRKTHRLLCCVALLLSRTASASSQPRSCGRLAAVTSWTQTGCARLVFDGLRARADSAEPVRILRPRLRACVTHASSSSVLSPLTYDYCQEYVGRPPVATPLTSRPVTNLKHFIVSVNSFAVVAVCLLAI